MLREAVRCGLTLDASGVALQNALQVPHTDHSELSDAALHDLENLRTQLVNQTDSASKVVDEWEDIHKLEAKLTPTILSDVVELCARYDSYPERGILSEDAKRPIKESLTAKWQALEYLPLQTRDYTPEGDKFNNVTR